MKKTNSGGKKIINQNRVKTKSFVGGKKQTLNEVYKINKYEIIWPKTFRHKKINSQMIKNTPPKCFWCVKLSEKDGENKQTQ